MYGDTAVDWITSQAPKTDDGRQSRQVQVLAGGITYTAWSARSGGTQLTDLLDAGASPITAVTSMSTGEIPEFQGPNGYTGSIYLFDPASATRFEVRPAHLGSRVTAIEASLNAGFVTTGTDQTVTSQKTFTADDDTKPAIEIDRSADVSTTSDPLIRVSYKGARTFSLNEWGGAAVQVPPTASLGYGDVGAKLFGRATNSTLEVYASTDTDGSPSFKVNEGDLSARSATASGVVTALTATAVDATVLGGTGAWQNLTGYVTANGYSAYTSTTQYTPKARLGVGGDIVELRGRIVADGTIAAGEVIATLPVGLRPPCQVQVTPMTSSTGSVTQLDVNADGTIVNQRALSTASWISLDGVTFFIGDAPVTGGGTGGGDVSTAGPQLAVHLHMYNVFFNSDDTLTTQYKRHIDGIAALNTAVPNTVSRFRVDIGWSTFMSGATNPGLPSSSGARSTWDSYPRRLANTRDYCVSKGIPIYVVVHQSPEWSRSAAWDDDDTPAGGSVKNSEVKRFPDDPNSIGPFAGWLGTFLAQIGIAEVEFWNEPNLTGFAGYLPPALGGGTTNSTKVSAATAARYMPLLKVFYTNIKATNPTIQVAAPGVSQSDQKWIRDCYAVSGASLHDYSDIICCHPYQGRQSVPPEDTTVTSSNADDAKKVRIMLGVPAIYAAMVANGDGSKPLWFTEQGWAADDVGAGGSSGGVSIGHPTRDVNDAGPMFTSIADVTGKAYQTMEYKAADFLGRMLEVTRTQFPYVTLHTVYEVFDPNQPHPVNNSMSDAQKHQAGFEIVNDDGTLKPQATKLKDWRAAHPTLKALY